MAEISIPGEPYTKIADVLNDALDHRYFFVKDIEVDYQYVLTSTVKELVDLLAYRLICRPRTWQVAR